MKILIRKTIFWIIAVIITVGASFYQRLYSPEYSKNISFEAGGEVYRFRLPRTHAGNTDCPIEIELPDTFSGYIVYRQFPTDNQWDTIGLYRNKNTLLAFLPNQPPASKLEYHIRLFYNDNPVELNMTENILIRFKGSVPGWALYPHVIIMFFAMLWSTTSGLQAAVNIRSYRKNSFITFILFVTGGLILGMIVHKYSLGRFWPGWPLGADFTANKILVSVIVWFLAFITNRKRQRRWVVISAAVILFILYMIPYNMQGSKLNQTTGEVISTSGQR